MENVTEIHPLDLYDEKVIGVSAPNPFIPDSVPPERPGSCLLWIRGLPYRQTVDVAPKTERGKREWAEMPELRAKGGI